MLGHNVDVEIYVGGLPNVVHLVYVEAFEKIIKTEEE